MLVVSPEEDMEHRKRGRQTLVCPVQGRGTAAVRAWMFEWCKTTKVKKVVMMDDDLYLQKRRPDMRCLGYSTEEEQVEMMNWFKEVLDQYVHAAFTERNAAWADTSNYRIAAKGIQVVGYNVENVAKTGCRFNKDVPDWFFIEDYHMTLQLFKQGLPNIVSRKYRVNFGSSNAPGGCSSFRTPERLKEAADLLASLHPEFVTPVQKETKSSFGGGVRWNVKVAWKKAFEYGQNNNPGAVAPGLLEVGVD
jgi:hypothetical protein